MVEKVIREARETEKAAARLVAEAFKKDPAVEKTRVCAQWEVRNGKPVFSHFRIRGYASKGV